MEDWPTVKERWESAETPVPEEVILVEELDCDNKKEKKNSSDEESEGITVLTCHCLIG